MEWCSQRVNSYDARDPEHTANTGDRPARRAAFARHLTATRYKAVGRSAQSGGARSGCRRAANYRGSLYALFDQYRRVRQLAPSHRFEWHSGTACDPGSTLSHHAPAATNAADRRTVRKVNFATGLKSKSMRST